MGSLAITFDDGPDGHWTPKLLDALAARGVRATFFVVAPRASAHPGLLERMLRDGHSVGLHCDAHVRHSERPRRWLEADTARALERLARLGIVPGLWRTPWGDRAPWTAAVAERHGMRLVDWSVDTHDWRGDGAAAMFAATRAQLGAGAIVLAHDGIGPGARRTDCSETIAYTELLAEHAAASDITLEPLR